MYREHTNAPVFLNPNQGINPERELCAGINGKIHRGLTMHLPKQKNRHEKWRFLEVDSICMFNNFIISTINSIKNI